MAKWRVTFDIDEEFIRNYHGQTPEDPTTTRSDAKDWFTDLLVDAAEVESGEGLGPGEPFDPANGVNCSVVDVKRLDEDSA